MEHIHSSWFSFFETHQPLLSTIEKCHLETKTIYPIDPYTRYKVFEQDLFSIKVVLLGQDPYHNRDKKTNTPYAMGLSFSVPKNTTIPPSLRNIYKEIKTNFPERNYEYNHGDLSRWHTEENIFLLNAALSVEEGKAGIFMKYWEPFTNEVIKYIALNNHNVIFILLGNYAISKSKFIEDKSRILTTSHPSPLGAYNGFIGSNIFKKCEEKLGHPINWNVD
jgi:uracil-DNA glycosylase